jgi:hypothetical protein
MRLPEPLHRALGERGSSRWCPDARIEHDDGPTDPIPGVDGRRLDLRRGTTQIDAVRGTTARVRSQAAAPVRSRSFTTIPAAAPAADAHPPRGLRRRRTHLSRVFLSRSSCRTTRRWNAAAGRTTPPPSRIHACESPEGLCLRSSPAARVPARSRRRRAVKRNTSAIPRVDRRHLFGDEAGEASVPSGSRLPARRTTPHGQRFVRSTRRSEHRRCSIGRCADAS